MTYVTYTMDPYEILKINKDSNEKDIKSAYKRRCKETHPDLAQNKNTDEFRLVSWAYKKITEPKKAGPCPVEIKSKPRSKPKSKTRKEYRNWGHKDHTLDWFDSFNREEYIVDFDTILQTKRKSEKYYEPPKKEINREPIGLEDLLRAEKHSKLGKKWAERMRSKLKL